MANPNRGISKLPSGAYRWRVSVNGRKLSGTEDTMAMARRARAEAQVAAGGEVKVTATVRELVDLWLADVDHSASSAIRRDGALDKVPKPFMARNAGRVTGPVVNALWNEMVAKGVGPSTIVKASHALSRSFEMGIRYGLVTSNPIRSVKPKPPPRPKRITPPSPAAVRALIGKFEGRDPYPTWIRLMAVCGARPGEVCGLQWRDLDEARSSIRIERSIDRHGNVTRGKIGEQGHRTINIDLPTFAALRRVPRRELCPWVFTDDGATPWDPHRVSRALRRVIEDLDIPHMRLYDLRHFAATQALAAGRPIPEVANMLGDNPATVMRVYAHAIPGHDRAAISVAAALDGP